MKDAHSLVFKGTHTREIATIQNKNDNGIAKKQIKTFCRKLCYLSVRSVRKGILPFTIPVYGIVGVEPFLMLEAIVSSFI